MIATLEQRQKQDLEDLRTVFNTKEGVRFLSHLLDLCGVYRISYSGEETGAMIFKEGGRNIGLAILNMLESFDESAYVKLAEADKERTIAPIEKGK
ncbi:MAG: hypothetical protein IJP88_10675 [Synergistaceae bacterium]|nr:hypothetical protein [Synergistaceae bacterium]MBR0097638.1 hypothetical protein [Synergistaceae bacterium]